MNSDNPSFPSGIETGEISAPGNFQRKLKRIINASPSLDKKRFIAPKNQEAQQKLHAFREVVEKIAGLRPEIAGATVFGSMTKGNADNKSDIDAFLFVDAEKIGEITNEEKNSAEMELAFKPVPKHVLFNDLAMKARFKPLIEQEMQEKTSFRPDINLFVRVLSKNIIEDEISKIIENEKEITNWEASISAIKAKRKSTDISEWDSTLINSPPAPIKYIHDWRITALFYMQVGRNTPSLREYRKQILESLKEEGELGQKVWSKIVKDLRDSERYGEQTKDKLYPLTINDAVHHYGFS